MNSSHRFQSYWCHLALAALLLLAAGSLEAATTTWTGGGGNDNWSTNQNWSGVLKAGDDVVFSGTTRLTPINDLAAGTSFNSITFAAGGFTVSGNAIQVTAGIANTSGSNILNLGLSLGAAQSITAASGTSLTVGGAITNGGFLSTWDGAGTIDCSGVISGTGGLTKTGDGTLILSGLSTYSGVTTASAGILRAGSDVIASTAGAFGSSAGAILLDGGTLQSATTTFSRSIELTSRSGSLDAYGTARTISAAIGHPGVSGGVIGSFVASNLRSVTQDDWRSTQIIAGTRVESTIAFPGDAFGTAAERAAFGIIGSDDNWEDFSAQWDGYLLVHNTTDISTRSDDSSRMWLDLNGNGSVDAGEWGSNGWGNPQGDTARIVHAAVAPGTYRFRVQYEEGNGGNRMWLLWSDSSQSGGALDGDYIIPASCLLGDSLSVGGVPVANATGQDLTLSGVISGPATLIKTGGSTVILGGSNTYTGQTSITEGVLRVTSAAGLGDATGFTVVGTGAALELDGAAVGAEALRLNGAGSGAGSLLGSGTASWGGTVTLDSAASIGGSGALTISGVISGSPALSKLGSGTVILSAANTFSGALAVDAGTLAVSGGAAVLDSVPITLADVAGATLSVNGSETIAALAGGGATGGAVVLGAAQVLSTGAANTSTTFSGAITGSGSWQKIGSGSFTLAGASTYTGATTVSAGSLRITAAGALGDAAGGTTVVDGAVLEIDGAAVAAEALTLNGDGSGGGALIGSGSAAWGGGITLASAASIGGSGTLSIGGVIGGSAALTKRGSGSCILRAANTYTGATTVTTGSLQLQGDTGTIAASSSLTIGNVGSFSIDGSGSANPDRLGNGITVTALGGSFTLATSSADRSETIGVLSLPAGASTCTLTTTGAGNVSLTASGGHARSGGATLAFVRDHAAVAGTARLFLSGTADGTILPWSTVTDAGSGIGRYSTTEGLEKLSVDRVTVQSGNWDDAATWNPSGVPAASESVEVASIHAVSLNGANRSIGTITFSGSGSITGAQTLSIGSGVLLVAGGGSPGVAAALDVGPAEAVIDSGDGTLTLSGPIAGTAGLTKGGAGTLRLSAANSYSGATSIGSGLLQAAHPNALGGSGDGSVVTPGGALEIDNVTLNAGPLSLNGTGPVDQALTGTGTAAWNGAVTLSGDATIGGSGTLTLGAGIAGAHALSKIGAGTLIVLGTSTYSGGTTITAGTLQGTTSSLPGAIANHATLIFDQTISGSHSSIISGSGSLIKNGSGSVALAAANSYTGSTTINAGTLRAGASVISSSDGAFGNAASTIVLGGGVIEVDTATFSRPIAITASGSRIDAYGTARTVSAPLSATGACTLHVGGTTASAAAGQRLSLSGVLSDGSGVLAVDKIGSSTVALTATNTYSGGTTVSAGALRVDTGSLPGDVVNHGSLVFDLSTAGTYSGLISGSGSLGKDGPGTLSLGAANTFTGSTTITAGTLRLDADVVDNLAGPLGQSTATIDLAGGILQSNTTNLSRAISVTGHGGRLDAYGVARTIASAISVDHTGHGGFVASFVNSNLRYVTEDDWRQTRTITGTRIDQQVDFLDYAFGTAGERAAYGIAGTDTDWDEFSVQWDGWIRVFTDGTSLAIGSDDSSRVWLDLDDDGVVDDGEWGSNGWGNLQNTTPGVVHGNLAAGVYRARIQYEEGNGNNSVQLMWDDARHAGASQGSYYLLPSYATPRRLSIGGTTVASAAGQDLTLSGVISGAGSLTKLGNSLAILSGASTYSGTTAVAEGILRLGASHVVPDTAVQVDAKGTLDVNGFTETIGALSGYGSLALGAGALTVGGDNGSATFTGVVSGTGILTKGGSGIQTLSGTNTYSGDTTIAAGTLRLTNASGLGATTAGTSVTAGATLDLPGLAIGAEPLTLNGSGVGSTGALTASGTSSWSGVITLATTSTIGVSGSLSLSGAIGGSGGLSKIGSGSLALSATSTYTGATSIAAGELQLSGDSGAIANSSALTIAQDAGLFIDNLGTANPNRLGDAITVTLGGGSLTLSAPLDVHRTETVGTLSFASGSNTITLNAAGTGNAQLTAASGQTRSGGTVLRFNRNNATGTANLFFTGETNSKILAWSTVAQGGVIKAGQYQTTDGLVQPSTTTHTSIASGNWDAGSTWNSGATPVAGDSVIIAATHAVDLNAVDRSITNVEFTGGGSITGAQTLTVSSGSIMITGSGAPNIAAAVAFGTTEAVIHQASSGTATLSGAISGSAGITKAGSGVLSLAAANTYSGTTTALQGILEAAHADGLGGTIDGTVVPAGGALRIANAAVAAEAVTIAGSGASGDGSLLGSGVAALGGSVTLSADSSLGGDGTLTLSGVVSGAHALSKLGAGTIILSANNTYSGATTIHAGALRAASPVASASNGAFGNASSSITLDAGTIEVDTATFSRGISVTANGGGLKAVNADRSVSSAISLDELQATGLIASFVNTSLTSVFEDDWRTTRTITGTRSETIVSFPNAAFGTAAERASYQIDGSDTDWENFSTQWDGSLVVTTAGTDLSSRSDDANRVWLDLNHDGVVQSGEWGSNGWGYGQGATTRIVHSGLAAGIYAMRIQYTEGGGGNEMHLLWDDAARSAGIVDNLHVVPTTHLLPPNMLEVAGDSQQLTLSGTLSGSAGVRKTGVGTVEITGANSHSGPTYVLDGTLRVTNASGSASGSGAITVTSGTTLTGTGAVDGLVTVKDGGAIAPGTAGTGTLSFNGGLIMEPSGKPAWNLGLGTASDLIAINGNLTLDGVVNVTDSGGFTAGSYTIATYTGTLTDNTLTAGTFPAGYGATVSTSTAGQVNLVVTAYTNSAAITFDTTASGFNVAGNVPDFPMLLRFDSSNFTFSEVRSDGADIRFADGDGTSLPYEIESWDAAAQQAEVWVLVPQVDGNSSSDSITMYWGRSDATSASDGSSVFANAGSPAGVWHLQQNPAGGNGAMADSSVAANHGSLQDAVSGDSVSTIIDNGIQLNGSSKYLSTTTAFTNPSVFTVSIWFKTTTTAGGKLIGFEELQTGSSVARDRHLWMADAGTLHFGIYDGSIRIISSTGSYNDGSWHLATARTSSAGTFLYVDGVQVAGNAAYTTPNDFTGYWRAGYGAMQYWEPGPLPSSDFFNGSIDEFRVAHAARSADFIKLSYETQKAGVTAGIASNSAPGQVVLSTPVHCPDAGTAGPADDLIATYGRTLDTTPALIWNIPADADADPLHFQVFLDSSAGSTQVANSSTSQIGFEYHNGSTWAAFPIGGATPGSGQVRYTPQSALATDDDHFWTVQAHDGTVAGATATVRRFLVATRNWTDGTLTTAQTRIRKVHVDELREETDHARRFRNLAAMSWSDATLVSDVTRIRKTHLDELRSALQAVQAIGGGAATIAAEAVVAGVTTIRAAHFQELRDATLDL